MTDTDHAFLRAARQTYVEANRGTLEWMLDRPRLAGAFLNTKQNCITLADYTDADGWRGPGFIYGWIQGRGLEALVTHADFFETEDPTFAECLDTAGRALYRALKDLYDAHGAAFFTYDRKMIPVCRNADGQPIPQRLDAPFFTYSDAFVLKGLIAASTRYDPPSRAPYLARLGDLVAAIEDDRFVMEEQRLLDDGAAARQAPEFGPRMIVLGAAALLRQLGLKAEAAFGDRFIAHVLARHCDGEGAAPSWLLRDAEGGDRCNVGHAIELAGFAMEYLPHDADPALVDTIGRILLASFEAGFTPPGLNLHVSARTRRPMSPYFPWWSLPETVRAAALTHARAGDARTLSIWRRAHEAFFAHYWRGTPAIAYQTRDANGPVDYVPATPDLDPGYHTGLSFLGAIGAIDEILSR